jgi:hypothetical protein
MSQRVNATEATTTMPSRMAVVVIALNLSVSKSKLDMGRVPRSDPAMAARGRVVGRVAVDIAGDADAAMSE